MVTSYARSRLKQRDKKEPGFPCTLALWCRGSAQGAKTGLRLVALTQELLGAELRNHTFTLNTDKTVSLPSSVAY